MPASAALPAHADRFHSNMGFALTRDGFRSRVNLWNYYGAPLFPGAESDAVVEVEFYDEDGALGFRWRELVPPQAAVSLDVGEELRRAGRPDRALGTVYARIVPLAVPDQLKGAHIHTEFMVEIEAEGRGVQFIHNTLGRSTVPTIGNTRHAFLVADGTFVPRYVVLSNNFFGTRLPLVGRGLARMEFTNHRGETRRATSGIVPRGGIRLFDLQAAIPDLDVFLDGAPARFELQCCNLMRKPWLWFESQTATPSNNPFMIEHL